MNFFHFIYKPGFIIFYVYIASNIIYDFPLFLLMPPTFVNGSRINLEKFQIYKRRSLMWKTIFNNVTSAAISNPK